MADIIKKKHFTLEAELTKVIGTAIVTGGTPSSSKYGVYDGKQCTESRASETITASLFCSKVGIETFPVSTSAYLAPAEFIKYTVLPPSLILFSGSLALTIKLDGVFLMAHSTMSGGIFAIFAS